MEVKQSKYSILMFPWLAHGHVFPYLELAKNLTKKNFHIYFCSTSINLSSITASIENTPNRDSIQLVELELPTFPDLPPQYHTTKNVPPNLMPRLFEALHNSTSNFSNLIISLKPDLLIYDAFQIWAAKIASSLGIPSVHFATSGAAAYSFFYHNYACRDSAFPFKAIYHQERERKVIQMLVDRRPKNDQDSPFAHFSLSCEIVLMRTSRALEGKYVDYLSALMKRKIVPVGPLIADAGTEEEDSSKIMEWLGKKSKFSTLFISFGSENYLSNDQMEEMAKGLDRTNVSFIWVVRSPIGETVNIEEALPKGFIERVNERGLIVKGWAPQSKILAHPTVGGFVSHCGTSSIFESIHFGVPIIGLPLKLDQPLNARLVVEARVGLEVARDENGNFGCEEFANAINKVFFEKSGEEMRLKADELGSKMKFEEEHETDEAAEQIFRLCREHKQQK